MSQLFDTDNELLAPVEVSLTVGLASIAGKQRLCLTIRSQTTTMTVLLNKKDAAIWAGSIAGQVSEMSDGGLIVPNGNKSLSSQ